MVTTSVRHRSWKGLAATLVVGAIVAAGCNFPTSNLPTTPVAPAGTVTIVGPSRLTSAQIVNWFTRRTPQPSGTYKATVPVATLAQIFVEEGRDEGIRGDVAFIQSVVETGWFRFGGRVLPSYNNFSGLGATDSGGAPAQFPNARTGVRAQIQHLRAYADRTATTCTVPPLHHPCVDPRFNLVSPKGKATTWNQMGNGNWATSTTYAQQILSLYSQMLAFNGVAPS
jgi:hypothetical protein